MKGKDAFLWNPNSSLKISCTRSEGKRGIERALAATVVPVGMTQVLLNIFFMRILRVFGLGLALVMLRFLLPRVFHGLENTLVAFFDVVSDGLALSGKAIGAIELPK